MPVRISPRLLLWVSIPIAIMIGLFGYVGRLNAIAAPIDIEIQNLDGRILDRLADDYLLVVNHRCGGVLVDHERVITSAHCVSLSRTKFGEQLLDPNEPETFRVSYGDREVGVTAVDIHSDYVSDSPEGSVDIAILTLDEPLDNGNVVHGVGSYSSADRLIYLARKSGARSVGLGECPDQLGQPYYDYQGDLFRCIDHAAQEHIGTCAGDSGSPILALKPDGSVILVAVQHAGHSLYEPLDTPCDNGNRSLAYGVTLVLDPLMGWVERER